MTIVKQSRKNLFNSLKELEEAVACLRGKPGAVNELAETIKRHGLENDVSIALLHKHYNLHPGEIVVGKIDGNQIFVNPTKTLGPGAIPYLWKLGGAMKSEWLPVEFMQEPEGTSLLAERSERIKQCTGFLADAANSIRRLHVEDILGVAVMLKDALPINKRQIFGESTDIATRMSTIQIIDKAKSGGSNSVETMWAAAKRGLIVLSRCIMCRIGPG